MTRLSWFGIICTVIYLAALTFLAFRYESFVTLKPNEIGDFLAGFFGPLAIFWLVLGFFQQGFELKNSVETLRLQATELSNSVRQQKELVKVTRDALQHERELLEAERAKEKRGRQPNFQPLVKATVGTGDGEKSYSFNLENIGSRASSITARVYEDESLLKTFSFNELPAKRPSPNTSLTDFRREPLTHVCVKIDYLDIDGNEQWQAFSLKQAKSVRGFDFKMEESSFS